MDFKLKLATVFTAFDKFHDFSYFICAELQKGSNMGEVSLVK